MIQYMSILFIDSSYVSFQCFFKTKRWFENFIKRNDEDTEDIEWHNNKIFMKQYKKNYNKIICRIVNSRRIPWSNVIFIKDCPRNEIWRHDIYDKYKATREANNKHFTGGLVFKYTHKEIFPYFVETYNCKTMRIDRAEADDVISILHGHIRKKYENKIIYLLAVDSDYIQVKDDHTIIINIYNKSIHRNLDKNDYILYKILNGDKSDNIPKCFDKHFTKTNCNNFNQNKEELTKLLKENPLSEKQFNLNKQLVLFSNIPDEIKENIITTFIKLML